MKDKSEKRISVQLPKAVDEAFKEKAKAEGTSKNAVIANTLVEAVLNWFKKS